MTRICDITGVTIYETIRKLQLTHKMNHHSQPRPQNCPLNLAMWRLWEFLQEYCQWNIRNQSQFRGDWDMKYRQQVLTCFMALKVRIVIRKHLERDLESSLISLFLN